MKRALSVILSVLLLLSLCGCHIQTNFTDALLENSTVTNNDNIYDEEELPHNDTTSSNPSHHKDSFSTTTSQGNQDNITTNNTTSNTPPKNPSSIVENNDTKQEQQKPTSSDTNTNSNKDDKYKNKEESVVVNTTHTAVRQEKYYQYSQLNENEKMAYNDIRDAVINFNNSIDISKYSFGDSTARKIMRSFLADNPQYFYLTETIAILSNTKGTSLKIYIYFTDGETVDKFDKNYNRLEVVANKEKISKQILDFEKKVTSLLKTIPTNIEDYEKEKIIQDYFANNVAYDDETAKNIQNISPNLPLPRAFDAYGALCENKVVCEGYAKAFQYLCYCVGINANQVTGTAGEDHMWNVVELQGQWYHTDPTWNKKVGDVMYYAHYNLTTAEMQKDHTITTTLAVPNCTATTYSYNKLYTINVVNTNSPPTNIEIVTERIQKDKNIKHIVIYVKDAGDISENYLKTHFFYKTSTFNSYIKQKGYNYSLSTNYYKVENYLYIPIIR